MLLPIGLGGGALLQRLDDMDVASEDIQACPPSKLLHCLTGRKVLISLHPPSRRPLSIPKTSYATMSHSAWHCWMARLISSPARANSGARANPTFFLMYLNPRLYVRALRRKKATSHIMGELSP